MDSIRGLKTYMPFARNIFQKLISYKANVIMFIFGDGLMLAVSYYLWRAIYDSADNKIINGFTANEMILYVFISFLTSLMTSVDISYDISDEVKSGSIAINLIRPISYEKRMFFQGIGNAFYNLVVIFIPAFIIVNIMAYNYSGSISIGRIVLYLVSISFSILINFYYSYIFGLLSFKITNMWGLSQIMQSIVNLLSGMLIPLTFFPLWAQKVVNFFPFSSAIYTPSMIFLGKINGIEIVKTMSLQIFWVVVLLIISKLMWKALIKSLTILGG